MYIDSHCHLDLITLQEDESLESILLSAKKANVSYMLSVATTIESELILSIAQQHANIFASIGLHPQTPLTQEPTVDQLLHAASHTKVIALGETGLDYYHDIVDKKTQHTRFSHHIEVAKVLGKPLIVHTRAAQKDTISLMREQSAFDIGGVMHCFTEDLKMATQALDLNFYISFSGIITFKNSLSLQQVVQHIPLDRILIETDSPYLAPEPFRGKPNRPAFVPYVAAKIAQLKNCSIEDVATITSQNFFNLFTHAIP